MSEPVTAAQEAVTNAMLAGIIACGALSLTLIQHFNLTTPISYAILTMTTFVVSAYLIPNLIALWLGRTLDDIMTDDTPTTPSQARQ
ncbi:hypothetical protein B4589_009740 [Halolamina sp. CBA1230]|uniref:hypothetical protein n=1 Tax=Halolamina sp. CBA1230 TaxID=1853690 RepID=UPI0009A24E36|nr:hypothetical protein [Halolamina sp. CBA1230]QKY20646.1 hypothetical protein B4589_009740 [Halolamina sp. CBA1230]